MELLQSFILGIIGNIIASTIVALFLVEIFRVPKLNLHIEYIKNDSQRGISKPILNFSVFNKKKWVGFGPADINFGLFLPIEFGADRNYFGLMTTEGLKDWNHDIRGKELFIINGKQYHHYRGVVHLAVHPETRTHFFTMRGDFTKNNELVVYYYFDTPHGRVPSFLKFGGRKKIAESGKLPLSKIVFDDKLIT